MKRIEEHPLDTPHWQYDRIADNMMGDGAHYDDEGVLFAYQPLHAPEIYEQFDRYIRHLSAGDANAALYGMALRYRFDSDPAFRRQIVLATLQFNSFLACIPEDSTLFYSDYLLPRLQQRFLSDFYDTKLYRLFLLENFSFDEAEEAGLYFSQQDKETGNSRIDAMRLLLKGE